VIAQYLHGYTTALMDRPSEKRPFRKAYIDAFAGTGYRKERREEEQQTQQGLLFPDLAEREPQELMEGSVKLAPLTQPGFDKYIFVERNPSRCQQLEILKEKFPALAAEEYRIV
jgi:three-Cys-motif partner protein